MSIDDGLPANFEQKMLRTKFWMIGEEKNSTNRASNNLSIE